MKDNPIKIFYTSKKYKDNWEKIFGKDERIKKSQENPEVIQKILKHCFDGYGISDWRDIRFKPGVPGVFDNFCIKHELLDGYKQFLQRKRRKK